MTTRDRQPTDPRRVPARGRFITLEGIDGCGKTTQAQRLARRLRTAGLTVLETREPGGTLIGAALRAVLLSARNDALEPTAELLLYLADRVQHLAQAVRPALARGETVVCDRFHDATVAYQQHARGLDLAPLRAFIATEVLTTTPHVTFWLDLDVAAARARMERRRSETPGRLGAAGGDPDESRLDSAGAAFHQRVRAGYEAIWRTEPERVVRIDAAGSADAVEGAIWAEMERRYEL